MGEHLLIQINSLKATEFLAAVAVHSGRESSDHDVIHINVGVLYASKDIDGVANGTETRQGRDVEEASDEGTATLVSDFGGSYQLTVDSFEIHQTLALIDQPRNCISCSHRFPESLIRESAER